MFKKKMKRIPSDFEVDEEECFFEEYYQLKRNDVLKVLCDIKS